MRMQHGGKCARMPQIFSYHLLLVVFLLVCQGQAKVVRKIKVSPREGGAKNVWKLSQSLLQFLYLVPKQRLRGAKCEAFFITEFSGITPFTLLNPK
jgi:hypothetical protein